MLLSLIMKAMPITIIKQAEDFCESHGHRLTDPRRYVLQILAENEKPLTAYEILNALGQYLDKPKPPTAYRAIEFWETQGFIHRIESLNAYILCAAGHSHNGSQFMICDDCGNVEEAHICSLPDSLQTKASNKGFNVSFWSVEIHGRCGDCRQSA